MWKHNWTVNSSLYYIRCQANQPVMDHLWSEWYQIRCQWQRLGSPGALLFLVKGTLNMYSSISGKRWYCWKKLVYFMMSRQVKCHWCGKEISGGTKSKNPCPWWVGWEATNAGQQWRKDPCPLRGQQQGKEWGKELHTLRGQQQEKAKTTCRK